MKAVLAMIAKAPEASVLKAIDSVIHLVDEAVLVVAPGDPLLGFTLPLPGRIVGQPWAGYAATRTAAYELASERAGPLGWVLMIDANDVALPKATAPWHLPTSLGDMFDAYDVPVDMRFEGGRWRWWRGGHVLRAGLPFAWRGIGSRGLHEKLVVLEGARVGRWPGLTVRPMQRPASERRDFDRDALEIGLAIADDEWLGRPASPRAVFFLAQSLKDAGLYGRSLGVYERRTRMDGDRDETFWAFLWLARLSAFLGRPHGEVVRRTEDAIAYAPDRAEGHAALARHLLSRSKEQPELEDEHRRAYARALACDYPSCSGFVDVTTYSLRALKRAGVPEF